jgi:hypothetical protein
LQYTDTPDRATVNGASTCGELLRTVIFLNYHHHCASSAPEVPWIHLRRFANFACPRSVPSII